MPRFSSVYKQAGPTRRIVQGENTCEKGMCWNNSPLEAGYVHTLLNYEIDQLTYNVNVAGGLHTTDFAYGSAFVDRITFNEDSDMLLVTQARNNYCLNAYEGITNIISVNKITIKNNQNLIEQVRQRGFAADDITCYKLLTYNPIDHKLMSVTLVKAARDKFFVAQDAEGNQYQLRRLETNPISCGFSEVWKTLDGTNYVSNKISPYHPDGATDLFIPRARRNSTTGTFGQLLHQPFHMQSVANCEGYGNKTFCFTKKKILKPEGPIVDNRKVNYKTITVVVGGRYGGGSNPGEGYKVGDRIKTVTTANGKTLTEQLVEVTSTIDYTIANGPDTTQPRKGGISGVKAVSWGRFDMPISDLSDSKNLTTTVYRKASPEADYAQIEFPDERKQVDGEWRRSSSLFLNCHPEQIVDSIEDVDNTAQDYYLKNCNTGTTKLVEYSTDLPLEAYKYGAALSACAILFYDPDNAPPAFPSSFELNYPYDRTIPDWIWSNSVSAGDLDLTTGTILKIKSPLSTTFTLASLPNTTRDGQIFKNDFIVSDLFDINKCKPNAAGNLYPPDWIKDDILKTIRKGQNIRLILKARTAIGMTRPLNSLDLDPVDNNYQKKAVQSVFVLDYAWNGASWNFSFIDTNESFTDFGKLKYANLVESWEKGFDQFGNNILRNYAWQNSLAYTDVLTLENQKDTAKHNLDKFYGTKYVYRGGEINTIYRASARSMTPDLEETIALGFDENTPAYDAVNNRSKYHDASYAHFEVKPKELTPGEAARWGYNMLSSTPYNFVCQNKPGTQTISLTGILLKDALNANNVLLRPMLNTPGILEVYYNCDSAYIQNLLELKYQLKVEYKNPTDKWRVLKVYPKEETKDLFSKNAPIRIPFTSPDENVLIKVTVYDVLNRVEVANNEISAVVQDQGGTFSIPEVQEFTVVDQLITTLSYAKDHTKVEPSPETYDLGTATGMTYWKGRLVLWGVLNADNMLFLSEPNTPEYFAYPNDIDLFEENIVHAINYGDSLLVFTSTKLWRIDLNQDGLSWTKTLLQQNLRITNEDIPYTTILKNMLFFKSGKQFYMLVPARGSVAGTLNIAPVSKAIREFLENPFQNILDILSTTYPELTGIKYSSPIAGTLNPDTGALINSKDVPITDYLVKYGTHTEHDKVFIDWWFDLTDWEDQVKHYSDNIIPDYQSSKYKHARKYWLFQLIYDTITYSWSLRTHTTNAIGVFVPDAVNQDVDYVSLVYNTPLQRPTPNDSPVFTLSSYGISLNHRQAPEDHLLDIATLKTEVLNPHSLIFNVPVYPRFQVLDTGYKEVSSPALKKRFREVQLNFEPSPKTEEGLRSTLMVNIDGHTVMSSVSQEVFEETEVDPITGTHVIIKIVDRINYHDDYLLDPNADPNYVPLPYLVDGELSNTFVLDSSALAGVKNVKIRRQLNGKGYLARLRFINITHAQYKLTNYAFIFHNKNAR